ncbi:MAG TPA: GHMP kinase [Thermoanaerobaculia bacterium]|nr:GHMP kinase [Thermoanaerobaculia bacterium]
MIIVRTPFRVSFAGGGTDLPSYYNVRGFGAVISAAIQKYTYIILHPKFDSRIRVFHYDGSELAADASAVDHEYFRAALLEKGVNSGVELAVISDVPGRGTGLGSSASLTVGLLHALADHLGEKNADPYELARMACHVEIDTLQSPVGKQDQYAVAVGGLNFMRFHSDDTVDVEPIAIDHNVSRTLQRRLLAFHTGISRKTTDILQHYAREDEGLLHSLDRIRDQAFEMRDLLQRSDLDGFARLLNEGWLAKRALSSHISTPVIDRAYEKAMAAGALAGKLCGAGGGGFLLVYAEEKKQPAVRAALSDMAEMEVAFDSQGTQTVLMEGRP